MICCFEGGWPIPVASVKSDLVEKYPLTRGPMLHVPHGTRSPSELPLFSATTRSSRWGRNEWSPAHHLLSEERVCCTCYNIWGQAMELCVSPLFISFPCAHPKIILPFREETLDQKSYSKQYLSDVSPGLTVSARSYCPCRDSPAWTFYMCSDRIDAVMVCEAEGPPIMRVYYFCWEHSHRDCRGV